MTSTPAESSHSFAATFGASPDGIWAAPGRVNLIGEHTDYNDGFVLPLALSHRCVVTARVAEHGSRVASAQRPGEIVEFSHPAPGDVRDWAAYVAGTMWAMRQAGYDVVDADILVDSDVPTGAGLSSSAALECAVASALADLSGLSIDRTELALIGQKAENEYVGAATGIMDQMASMHGADGKLVFIDTRSREVELVPFDPGADGLALLVVDTRAPHALVDGQYEARRRSCEAAASILGVRALRDVTLDDLDAALARLDDDVQRRRVRHVVTEDARVLDVVARLRAGDIRGIGPDMIASHASLRDDFEVTVPHLDVAVEAALAGGAFGARMTGGGFGGSIVVLTDRDRVEAVRASVEETYAQREYDAPRVFDVVPSQGAHRIA